MEKAHIDIYHGQMEETILNVPLVVESSRGHL